MAPVNVPVNTTFNPSGTNAAQQAFTKVAQQASKADKAILASAQVQAKLAQASGQAAKAEQTLSAALAQVDRSSLQAIRTQTQLVNIQSRLANEKGPVTLPRTIDGISGSALKAVTALTGVGSALALVNKGADLAQLGANADLLRTRFDSLAQSANMTGDALLAALRKGSGGEISDLNLQLAANKAQLLDVAHSAEEFGVLMSIARDRAQQMGISTTQAFDDLTTGLGRGSRLILDNLGIIVNADAANEAYAASLGKTAAALTDAERKQALINQVLKDGAATMAATGGAVTSTAGTFAQLGAASDNAQAAIGKLLASILALPAEKAVNILVNVSGGLETLANADKQLQDFSARAFEGATSLEHYQSRVAAVNSQLAPFGAHIAQLSDVSYQYAQALRESGVSADEAFAKAQQYGGIVEQVTAAQTAAGVAAGDWGAQAQNLGQQVANLAATSDHNRAAVESLALAYSLGGMTSNEFAAAIATLEQRHIATTQAAAYEAVEENRLAAAHMLVHGAVNQEAQALAEEIAKKQESELAAAKLAQVQATLAQLGGAVAGGMQTAGAAATILAGRYGIAYAEALKLINAQAALARMTGTVGPSTAPPAKRDAIALQSEKNADRADALAARRETAAAARRRELAENERIQAVGTTQQKIALAQKEYDAAVKTYGAQSDQAYALQTKLLQAQQQGSTARAGAASAGGTKLANIEMQTGNKIEDLAEKTADKLADIARRSAEEQAAAYRKLQSDIATSAADARARMEANDLDLIGVSDPDQAAKLNDRERAEADARKRSEEAAAEARARAEEGEAEAAGAIYDIRQKQIADQQALDEQYYARQRELAENPEQLAALQQQYEEATRAYNEQAQVRIDLANAEAAQKKVAIEEEKAAVIAAADEQAAKVTSRAQQSAAAVKAASADARSKAVADLKAIGDAVNAIPSQKTINVTTTQTGTGGTGATAAAGGGKFLTSGPTTLTVGDNPGGVELVSVTPISGKGQTRVGGGMAKLAGGGTVVVDAGDGYTTPIAGADIPVPGKGKKGKSGGSSATDAKQALDEMRNVVALLMDMAKLKEQIAALKDIPAFDIPTVQALADRARQFTEMVMARLIPLTKDQGEALKRYQDVAQGAASLIGDMAGLKKEIAELKDVPAFDIPTVLALIDRARQFTEAMQSRLIPLTEFEAEQFSRYASAVGDSVSIISDLAGLKKDIAELKNIPAFDQAMVIGLADEARRVTEIMRGHILPTTEDQAKGLSRYADAAGAGISILSDIAGLRKDLEEGVAHPLDERVIVGLADEAVRVTKIMQTRLVPTSEEQAKQLSLYADAVGSGVGALKDTLGLSGMLFADYTSPTDAQINLLATDAQRVVRGVVAAASTFSKEGLEAGKLYAEGVGATFSAFKDGLLFFDALKSGDFQLDVGALAKFEDATGQTLGVARRLGAIASTIPAGDIAALQTTTAALAAQSEALIRLAAVPFGDLPGAAVNIQAQAGALLGGASRGGAGGQVINVNIYNPPANMDVPGVVRQVKQALTQEIRSNR